MAAMLAVLYSRLAFRRLCARALRSVTAAQALRRRQPLIDSLDAVAIADDCEVMFGRDILR